MCLQMRRNRAKKKKHIDHYQGVSLPNTAAAQYPNPYRNYKMCDDMACKKH